MICHPIKPTLGRWHIRIGFDRPHYCELGWRRFEFACFRINAKPEPGECYSKKHYTGFWLRIRFFWPVEIE